MDGSDMAFDYKAVAAGIARSEGMGALLPVVEKELLHYRILSAMQDGGFFGPIVFQGGTSLRLCHGSPRYSEDLDFAGGTGFGVDDLRGLGECVRSSLAGMSPDVQVKVREPVRDEGLVRRWRISIRTAAQRRDLPSQSIKLEVASVPAHEPQTRPVRVNYPSVSAIAGDIILAVESPTEILADKLLSFACSSHIRRRDLWDMCWLSSRADVDASRAFRMATLKAGEYGEVGEWEARAGRLRETRRCCLRTPFWTRCEGSCRPECSSPPSNPSPGASTPRRRSPGCMIPPGPHGRRRMARRVSGGRCLSPTSLPPFPCGVTGVPLFPEAASSPHSHLIRSARSMGLWYGSVTSMRRVGRP